MTLKTITAPCLSGTPHGFFTRSGGASSGVFCGLNCGKGSSDQADVVAINRARVAQFMDVPTDHLISLNQIHSADVTHITGPIDGALPRTDAMVTRTEGVALGILTADCQPVLLADREHRVIGAAHAGWKGALGGVLEATIDAMVGLGAKRDHIRAVIGPTISQRAYEVGPEFIEQFMDHDPEYGRFFVAGTGDRLHFDLPGFGLFLLRRAGVAEAEWTRHCTYADPDRFFSYRRSVHLREADYGRLISTIRL